MRLIDADALIQKRNHAKAYAQDMYVIGQGYVMDAPTIDAVPVVRGEWIPNQHWEYRNGSTTMSGDTGMGCSVCGAVNFTGMNQCTPFCPNCGAKMEDKQ